MEPHFQGEMVPRDVVLHLISSAEEMQSELLDAAHRWHVLDKQGQVPVVPSYPALLQHAADAQRLSRDVVELAAGFADGPHRGKRAGRVVLAHLAAAATLSTQAPPLFAQTAQTALSLSQSSEPTAQQYPRNAMVIDHASARSYLRRASESLRDAAKELHAHLDLHHIVTTLFPRDTPVPAPPTRSAPTAEEGRTAYPNRSGPPSPPGSTAATSHSRPHANPHWPRHART